MCDQTEVQYLPGEVVWVKLRALWWPGLVQDYDSLPEEITSSLKKRPIATVKFFQEDSYEYVHKLDLIYHYNCSRKHEFIKKGIDLCRKKSADRPTSMDTFPSDIVTAEELTHGDPNILQDEAFKPEEKPKYTSLFGSEKKKFGKKKGKEDSPLKDKLARRKKITSKLQAMGWLSRGVTANIIYPEDVPRIITHRRFLNKARNPDGKSDYTARIMEQKCEDEPERLPDKSYECVLCGYATRRLNVIVIHFNTTHSRKAANISPPRSILKGGSYLSPHLKIKGEPRKSEVGRSSLPGRKRMSTKAKVDTKVKKDDSEGESSDNEVVKPQPIKKEKGRPGRKRKVKLEEKDEDIKVEAVKKPKVLDFLLDDWEEDIEQDKEAGDEDNKILNKDDKQDDIFDNESASFKKSPTQDTSASKSKEIFEFDPDEDDNIEFNLTPNVKGFGRRIPRVIESPKEKKRGSSETKKGTKEKGSKKKEKDEKDDDFESLLAETSVPSLPSVPKSSTFSLDTDDVKSDELSDESGSKAILKELNDSEKAKAGSKKQKNFSPEVDLAVDSKNPPQGRKQTNTAKVTVEMVPELSVGTNDIDDVIPQPNIEVLKNEGKPGQSTGGGDHTYVSGNAGRKRRRSLLPLEKNDGNIDILTMPVVLGSDFAVEEAPRVNKQPFLPNVGSNVVNTPPRRRVGRPPKRGGRGSKSMRSAPVQPSPKSPPPVRGSKSPSPRSGPKSPPSAHSVKSPMRHAGSASPPYAGPKSPLYEQSPKSPDGMPKSPHHHSSRSPKGQGPKSPVGASSPDPHRGHKSPPPHQSPRSPRSPHHSPSYQGPKSPQGLQSPKSPLMSVVSAASPTNPKNTAVSDLKTLKSSPGSPVKTIPADFPKSPVKSPQAAAVSQTVLLSSTKSTNSRILTSSPSISKAGPAMKKVNTSGAVVVQSQPDLQPEACGIGKILSSPTSVASSTGGTFKTIKVAVPSTPGASPVVVGKAGTSGTRKVMIVQNKGGTQRMILPSETSKQILSNIGSGKKIIFMSKGSSGSPGKLVLTSSQQKVLASGGKVTTASGQVIGSKGTVLSSVAKFVSTKPSTAGTSTGIELSTEPPALVKSEPKKTYKIISPQTKGSNILLKTSSGQILVPASSIASASGVNTPSGSKFILPAGKNMKLVNAVTGSGQKVIVQMKSTPTKTVLSSPKTVQPIVPKTVQSISPKASAQNISSKTLQTLSTRTVQPFSPKTGQSVKFAKMTTMVQPVPQLTPIGSPIASPSQPNKVGRPKQIKPVVTKPVKSPQPKSPRKSGAMTKTMQTGSVVATSSTTTVVLPSTSPQKRTTGILPSPTLTPIAQVKPTKKVSLAAKPAPVETQVAPQPVQVVSSAVPALDQIQTTLIPSVDPNSAVTLPTSSQQLIAVPTEDGGQVMYLIDNSSLLGLDGTNQANLSNVILTFDNMVQPSVSTGTSDFTFSAPSSGQDILAEALANTQVLQSEGAAGDLGLDTSGLLSSHSSSTIFPPTLSHGVLETSLTLNQPIMTPLEDLSGVSTLQPPPVSSSASSVDLPSTITVPDITISTSSYSSLPIPSATIQSTVFSDSQSVSTFSTSVSGDGGVFIEAAPVEGESYLTSDSVYEPAGEGASMPSLDG